MHTRKVTLLTIGVLMAGCAQPHQKGFNYGNPNWKSGGEQRRQNAPDPTLPQILPKTHFAAARLHEQQGLTDEAVRQYRKAIALNHDYVDAYHGLGVLLVRIGRAKEAATVLRKAVQLSPDSALLRNNLGYALMRQEKWEPATQQFEEAVKLQPYFARAHINLGITLSKQGRFDDAFESFRAVLPLADAYYNLGLMLRAEQENDRSVDAFEKVLQIDPSFTAARQQLAKMDTRTTPAARRAVAGAALAEAHPTGKPAIHRPQSAVADQEHEFASPGAALDNTLTRDAPLQSVASTILPDGTVAFLDSMLVEWGLECPDDTYATEHYVTWSEADWNVPACMSYPDETPFTIHDGYAPLVMRDSATLVGPELPATGRAVARGEGQLASAVDRQSIAKRSAHWSARSAAQPGDNIPGRSGVLRYDPHAAGATDDDTIIWTPAQRGENAIATEIADTESSDYDDYLQRLAVLDRQLLDIRADRTCLNDALATPADDPGQSAGFVDTDDQEGNQSDADESYASTPASSQPGRTSWTDARRQELYEAVVVQDADTLAIGRFAIDNEDTSGQTLTCPADYAEERPTLAMTVAEPITYSTDDEPSMEIIADDRYSDAYRIRASEMDAPIWLTQSANDLSAEDASVEEILDILSIVSNEVNCWGAMDVQQNIAPIISWPSEQDATDTDSPTGGRFDRRNSRSDRMGASSPVDPWAQFHLGRRSPSRPIPPVQD